MKLHSFFGRTILDIKKNSCQYLTVRGPRPNFLYVSVKMVTNIMYKSHFLINWENGKNSYNLGNKKWC